MDVSSAITVIDAAIAPVTSIGLAAIGVLATVATVKWLRRAF